MSIKAQDTLFGGWPVKGVCVEGVQVDCKVSVFHDRMTKTVHLDITPLNNKAVILLAVQPTKEAT